MFISRRTLSALRAEVADLRTIVLDQSRQIGALQKDTDPVELERLRGSVLNALRALNRTHAAWEAAGDTNGKGARVQIPPPDPPGPRRNY